MKTTDTNHSHILQQGDYQQYILTLRHKGGRPETIQGGIPRHFIDKELQDFFASHPEYQSQYWSVVGFYDTTTYMGCKP